ncbi:hypothetical protein [Symbiopectobacterium purcellii]|uniref:hypothetical protein n=1 Tax=Symbiopectobacterium purcellii TaxID=2871826 RepID=UPI003F855360
MKGIDLSSRSVTLTVLLDTLNEIQGMIEHVGESIGGIDAYSDEFYLLECTLIKLDAVQNEVRQLQRQQ